MSKFFEEFKKFITRGNVIDMAVGVIVGSAFTAIVNNSNLGNETTAATVRSSLGYVESLSCVTGLPVWLHTAKASVAAELSGLPVLPLVLQKKFFDLPD